MMFVTGECSLQLNQMSWDFIVYNHLARPLEFFLCSSYPDTLDHVTTKKEMHENIMNTLTFLVNCFSIIIYIDAFVSKSHSSFFCIIDFIARIDIYGHSA